MGLYNAYRCDPKVEAEGVWFPFDGGFRLRLARAGGANTDYLKALAEESNALEGSGKNLLDQPALARIYARSIVREVEGDGFVDEQGKAIGLGSDELAKAFVDLPEFFLEVINKASNRRFYTVDAVDEAKR